ncbi:extracellular solute-binding protein [Vagococcus sp.]|uniref:extracellular solute-binding protein n=1 Tax=Vagococcus sp. TaxID=1933889 RepID=UPI003F9D61ED
MKKRILGATLGILAITALISGCSSKGAKKSDELYIFNTKSEISEPLKELAKDYEKETGIKVKTFSPGSGADVTETMNTEMTSKNAPAIFATNSLITWGPKEGDFMYNLNDSSNDKLKKLASEVPENMRLNVDEKTNFGIPYTVEGYGYVVDTKVLSDLFSAAETPALLADLKKTNYEEFIKFTDSINAFIHDGKAAEVQVNGNKYQLASEKTELTKELTGVFVEAGAEKWTYSDHMINVPMNTVYSSYSDALYAKPNKFKETKDSLIKYMEVLEYNTAHAAGEKEGLKRGTNFINGTTGSYDNSLQLFADHKGLFIKQGNWIYPTLTKLNEPMLATLDMIPIKMPFEEKDIKLKGWTPEDYNQTIPTFVPNYWVINKQANEEQIKQAEDFIVWLYTSDRGLKFLTDESGFILFNDLENATSTNTLNRAIQSYLGTGKTMSNPFNASPGNFLEFVGNELKENYMTKEKWDAASYPDFADEIINKWIELKKDSQ